MDNQSEQILHKRQCLNEQYKPNKILNIIYLQGNTKELMHSLKLSVNRAECGG